MSVLLGSGPAPNTLMPRSSMSCPENVCAGNHSKLATPLSASTTCSTHPGHPLPRQCSARATQGQTSRCMSSM